MEVNTDISHGFVFFNASVTTAIQTYLSVCEFHKPRIRCSVHVTTAADVSLQHVLASMCVRGASATASTFPFHHARPACKLYAQRLYGSAVGLLHHSSGHHHRLPILDYHTSMFVCVCCRRTDRGKIIAGISGVGAALITAVRVLQGFRRTATTCTSPWYEAYIIVHHIGHTLCRSLVATVLTETVAIAGGLVCSVIALAEVNPLGNTHPCVCQYFYTRRVFT